jgi:hypothetical protein
MPPRRSKQPFSGRARSNRVLRPQRPDRAEYRGPVALGQCDHHRGFCFPPGWPQDSLYIRAGISIQTAGKCSRPWRVAKINASGEAYKLASVAEFPGSTRQGTGAAGSSTSGRQEFVAAEQRRGDHASSRFEYGGDASSRTRRDLYQDGSVISGTGHGRCKHRRYAGSSACQRVAHWLLSNFLVKSGRVKWTPSMGPLRLFI